VVGLIAFGRPDSSVISPEVYGSKFKPTYQVFVTMTTPAAVTMSTGLPADASAGWRIMVFASPSGELYLDETTSFHLP
jgi:hypothetical protein